MKKTYAFFNLLPLIFLAVYVTICNDSEIHSESDQQIGENILEIFEDKDGILWFGTTSKGVATFNGNSLDYLTIEDGLCGNTVANIAEDKSGNLWIGTHTDMCIYKSKRLGASNENSFISFAKDENDVPMLGWGWKSIQVDREGSIWVNTHHGVFRYQDSSFYEYKVPNIPGELQSFCNTPGRISMDLEDSKGNLWFGTDGDGVYKYDGKSFTQLTRENGLLSNNITGIVEDKLGNIWFSCISSTESFSAGLGGVCYYSNDKIITFKKNKGLYDNNIQTIYTDKSGHIWIGATGFGLYRVEASDANEIESGKAFTFYTEPEGVNLVKNVYINGLQSMLQDSKGRIWLGYSGGLFRLIGNSIVSVKQSGPWQ